MFTNYKTLIIPLLFSLFAVVGCTKEEAGPSGCDVNFSYTAELQNEADALIQAGNTYGQDPTEANCNAFKNAYQVYLDAAEEIENCVQSGDRAEYEESIKNARDELDELECI